MTTEATWRSAARHLLCAAYTSWWHSKRYGLLSRIDGPLRVLVDVVLPFSVALSLVILMATGSSKWLQVFNILLLFVIGFGHLGSYLLQRSRIRPRTRDVNEVSRLHSSLDSLLRNVRSAKADDDMNAACRDFVRQALDSIAIAVCNDRMTHASIMFQSPKKEELRVSISTAPSATLDPDFSIPLVRDTHGDSMPVDGKGLAGFAYGKGRTMYMPCLATRACWQLDLRSDGSIAPQAQGDVWRASKSRRFRSVLATPILVDSGKAEHPIGVLNLESPNNDSFNDADFHIIGLTARMIGKALYETYMAHHALQKSKS